jgi:hypothetical protein
MSSNDKARAVVLEKLLRSTSSVRVSGRMRLHPASRHATAIGWGSRRAGPRVQLVNLVRYRAGRFDCWQVQARLPCAPVALWVPYAVIHEGTKCGPQSDASRSAANETAWGHLPQPYPLSPAWVAVVHFSLHWHRLSTGTDSDELTPCPTRISLSTVL